MQHTVSDQISPIPKPNSIVEQYAQHEESKYVFCFRAVDDYLFADFIQLMHESS